MLKYVPKHWLYQRAKSIETKNLKKYGKSLTAGSICGRLEECITCIFEDIDEIDYEKYKEIRNQLLKWGENNA